MIFVKRGGSSFNVVLEAKGKFGMLLAGLPDGMRGGLGKKKGATKDPGIKILGIDMLVIFWL